NRSRIRINKWYQSFALRNFDLEDMEFESANCNTTTKLPILKLGEYKMWVIRIKQYFQIQDYALWEVIENESLDSIFNRLQKILSPEWNTHVVVWTNKSEDDTMSIDDLYNNFKIIKQKVKKSVGAISTASKNVNTASPQVSTASFSDNVVNGFEVTALIAKYEGKEVLSEDRECRAPRSKEGQFKNLDNTRKQGNNEDTSSKAMLAINGVGFNWSDMAEEQVQTNMALMFLKEK
ncbi:hypothetical protein Tco_1521518, partial [Tanacetum coccineum]